MRKKYVVLLFIGVLLFSGFLYAKAEEESLPEGMEIIKVGGAEFLVPKGTKMRKKGDMNIIEDITEYLARKFVETRKQLENIEAKHNNLENETKENFNRLEKNQEEIDNALTLIKKDLLAIKVDINKKNSDTN
ncbi:MAG: hypothetical protein KAJ14_13615 [Candidatus Omnitrophica bacterium]|nr:hypothetical protein [Candidatus Omnitrophota bacterium]